MRGMVVIGILLGVALALGAIMRAFMPDAPEGGPEGCAILYVAIGCAIYAILQNLLSRSGSPASVRYRHLSAAWGVPGVVLQFGACFLMTMPESMGRNILLGLGATVGTAMLLVGSAFYAKSKAQHPAWCLLGLMSVFGLFFLARLDDESKQPGQGKQKKRGEAGPVISRRADMLWLLFTAILTLVLIMAFALNGSSSGYGTRFVAVGIAMAPYLLYRRLKTNQGKPPKRR